MADYSTLPADARTFLNAVARNNTRDWWAENKATYEAKLKAPALELLEILTPRLAALADCPVKPKLFLPHRDVRFSKDKTPYTTHLHMMWATQSGARQSPVFYFGIGLDYVTAGVGMMGFDKPVLDDWRKMVDLDAARISGIVAAVEAQGFSLREPALKRVPPPYDKAHPQERLLRMKGVVASRDVTDVSVDGLMEAFTAGWPINELLISIADG